MLNARIFPKVIYSMLTIMFSEDQCRQLNTPIDKVMLNKLHLNRHTPKTVLYSSREQAGLDYPSFRICQDQKCILTLLKHLWWDGTVGNDILVVMSAVQLISGLCEPLMEDGSTNISYIGPDWILHLRSKLRTMNGQMWIEF